MEISKSYWICVECHKIIRRGRYRGGGACYLHLQHNGKNEIILTDPEKKHHPQCLPKLITKDNATKSKIKTKKVGRNLTKDTISNGDLELDFDTVAGNCNFFLFL